jgi:hypothetical protein
VVCECCSSVYGLLNGLIPVAEDRSLQWLSIGCRIVELGSVNGERQFENKQRVALIVWRKLCVVLSSDSSPTTSRKEFWLL